MALRGGPRHSPWDEEFLTVWLCPTPQAPAQGSAALSSHLSGDQLLPLFRSPHNPRLGLFPPLLSKGQPLPETHFPGSCSDSPAASESQGALPWLATPTHLGAFGAPVPLCSFDTWG